MDGVQKKKCLWCKTELDDGFFCKGGGPTIERSNTGEGLTTKSYCYDSFLAIFKFNSKFRIGFSEEEQYYMLWSTDIKEWYKSILFTEDKSESNQAILPQQRQSEAI